MIYLQRKSPEALASGPGFATRKVGVRAPALVLLYLDDLGVAHSLRPANGDRLQR
ncbi:MAG TPA: hypothetical protein VJ739_02140 [Gemmataceae bacterium]|nr:hypothetical protein [Gemmataceae bacterium]